MKISASIYSDKNRNLKDTIEDLVAHQVDLLHVDCNDNLSVFDDIRQIRSWCELPIDLHIITETPENYVKLLEENPVEFLTFQFEELPANFKLPNHLKGEKGLAITTPTPVEVFDDYSDFDFILFMATIPGQSGGVFDAENFKKIRSFKRKYPNKKVHVDGGVNGEVSFILRNMGVYASVSGSFLFKAASVGQALMDLTKREIRSTFQVKDFMVPRLECPVMDKSNISLKGVLEAIEHGNLGFVMIEEKEVLQGIISNADVRRALLKNIDNIQRLDPIEMINSKPIIINENDTVNDMLRLVRNQDFPIMYLPVQDELNRAAGVVTFVNLIKGEY